MANVYKISPTLLAKELKISPQYASMILSGKRKWDLSKRLGSYAEYPDNWEKNSVINLLYLLDGKSLKIIFDCGVNDFFYDANVRVHEKMLERNNPHDFIVRPGSHEWDYWVNAIQYQLLFFNNFFSSN